MCGLAGVARAHSSHAGDRETISAELLTRMARALRHRGPDGFGLFVGGRVGLAHLRLSIIDVAGGAQPLGNEDGRVVIVYNGEVYNYVELREELIRLGHRFRTASDTEVLVHAYEEWGTAMLPRLNGQFAFALYDQRDDSMLLVRDRFGVRPLFYAERHGTLYFASEIKGILASGEVDPALDPEGFDEVFTFWAARPPRTPFKGIRALEPGCYAVWRDGRLRHGRYYAPNYPDAGPREEPATALETLDQLLRTSVALRLRSDVPVGGYLSGGLDSTIGCALAAAGSPHALRTFSVTFDDPAFDESAFQRLVAADVGSQHAVQPIGSREIGSVFPDVVWHAETPLVRTAAAPMYLLSRLARERDIKVVLTGEGADELFLGYDLFKEVAVRQFCLRQPGSTIRPRLFDRLYPYLAPASPSGTPGGRGGDFWRRFFLDAGPVSDPLFSHLPRFHLTARIKDFYAPAFRDSLSGTDAMAVLRDSLPAEFTHWSALDRAAYLEMTTLLSPYLLSSQGDRMAMAHGVEGRFPFLDHRVFEFAAALPEGSKLRSARLREKDILRRWAVGIVPERVRQRHKQPYRAPEVPAFFGAGQPDYVEDALGPSRLKDTGVFAAAAVEGLLRRCRAGQATGIRENQALVAVLSTQLWHDAFVGKAGRAGVALPAPDVVLHPALAPVAT